VGQASADPALPGAQASERDRTTSRVDATVGEEDDAT
jgi:hypothetical protein